MSIKGWGGGRCAAFTLKRTVLQVQSGRRGKGGQGWGRGKVSLAGAERGKARGAAAGGRSPGGVARWRGRAPPCTLAARARARPASLQRELCARSGARAATPLPLAAAWARPPGRGSRARRQRLPAWRTAPPRVRPCAPAASCPPALSPAALRRSPRPASPAPPAARAWPRPCCPSSTPTCTGTRPP